MAKVCMLINNTQSRQGCKEMNTFLPMMGMQTETFTQNRNLTVCNQCLTHIHDL